MKNKLYLLSFLLFLTTCSINAQILTSVVPDSATQCQKLTISVTGENTNFHQGTSFISLYNQSVTINATNSTVVNPTEIEGVFFFNPNQPLGSYDVSVNNGAWGDIILTDGFTLHPPLNYPQLISLTPDTAYKGGSVVINIVGEHTHFDAEGIYNSVWFQSSSGDHIYGTSVTATDSLHMHANLAISTLMDSDIYTLHINNSLDGEIELTDALVVMENGQNPEIVSVDPNSAHQGEGLSITVTGSETTFLQGSSMLRLYNNNSGLLIPVSHEVVNDTILTGYFEFSNDNDTGYYDVKIINWLLEDLVLADGFYLFESGDIPNLISISPDNAYQGTAVTFTITAENTHFDKEGNTVSVTLRQGYLELFSRDIRVIDSVTLEADFVFSYANALGLHDLIVQTTFDGILTMENCFNMIEAEPNASVVSVVPDSAYLDDELTISVTGKNIVFMQGTSNISLSQGSITIASLSDIIVNDTVIDGTFNFLNTFPLGKYDVNIDNGYAWPWMTLANAFTLKIFDFIDEPGSIALLTVFPNPTDGLLNIRRNFNVTGTFDLLVYDALGNLLLKDQITTGTSEKQLDLTSYKKGVYFLKIIQGEKEQTKRFIIK